MLPSQNGLNEFKGCFRRRRSISPVVMSYLYISWEKRLISYLTIIFPAPIGIKSLLFLEQKEERFGFAYLKRHMQNFMGPMITPLLVFVLKDLKH